MVSKKNTDRSVKWDLELPVKQKKHLIILILPLLNPMHLQITQEYVLLSVVYIVQVS